MSCTNCYYYTISNLWFLDTKACLRGPHWIKFGFIVVWGAMQLNIGAHHTDPLWAFGTAVGFLAMLITDVALFFGVAKDAPFKWE